MKKIYYLGSYIAEEFYEENRYCSLACMNKMKGIISALNDSYDVEIISSCLSHGKKVCNSHEKRINGNVNLILFSSLGRKNRIFRVLDVIWFKLQLIAFFFRNICKSDKVIVYHSLIYVETILLLKKIIGFDLILEFEELYSDVWKENASRGIELKLLKKADKYIFPTKLIPQEYGVSKDKYVIIHGNYCCKRERESSVPHKKTEIVYAGNLEPRKGCIDAILAAQYLSDNYHISVLGTGSEKEIERVNAVIKETNEKGGAEVTFKGVLLGREYEAYLQTCDIGLCTQDPEAEFTNTSFPSKILSYLTNGLRVLSIDIPSVRGSDVSPILYFYNAQTPEEIANSIKKIDIKSDYDSVALIHGLFEKSRIELRKLIEEGNEKSVT